MINKKSKPKSSYLVDGQINARVRDDAEQVGHVAAVEVPQSSLGVNLGGSVEQSRVLPGRAKAEPRLEHLHGVYHSLGDGAGGGAREEALHYGNVR